MNEERERPVPDDDYLTPSQVALILHVSPKTVDRWADQGRIGCIVTLGGHRRFPRREVVTVAEEMSRRGAVPASGR
jgi:excisionase family DNA binding protein